MVHVGSLPFLVLVIVAAAESSVALSDSEDATLLGGKGRRGGFLSTTGSFTMSAVNRAGNSEDLGTGLGVLDAARSLAPSSQFVKGIKTALHEDEEDEEDAPDEDEEPPEESDEKTKAQAPKGSMKTKAQAPKGSMKTEATKGNMKRVQIDPESLSGAPKQCDPKCHRSCCTCEPELLLSGKTKAESIRLWNKNRSLPYREDMKSCKTCRGKETFLNVVYPRNAQTRKDPRAVDADLGECWMKPWIHRTKLGACSFSGCQDAATTLYERAQTKDRICNRVCLLGGVDTKVYNRQRIKGGPSKYGYMTINKHDSERAKRHKRMVNKLRWRHRKSHAICIFNKVTACHSIQNTNHKGCKCVSTPGDSSGNSLGGSVQGGPNTTCKKKVCPTEDCTVTKTIRCHAIVPFGHGMTHLSGALNKRYTANGYHYEGPITQQQKDECDKVANPCGNIGRMY